MPDYEIRVLRPDGSTSLRYFATFAGDDEAKAQIREIKIPDDATFEIWRDAERITDPDAA
ncbi:MAG TPA: hypothetical protein VGF56_01375 [Rhizomicrobium sp.]|jgi:hypothetical protein